METSNTHKFAILAPVPEQHLFSGLKAIKAQLNADPPIISPFLAYGSRAYELFREADLERDGRTVDMFIYASHAKNPTLKPQATWRATYIGHKNSRNGRYIGKPVHRPPSTASDQPDYWAIYWLVQDLEPLKPSIPISEFQGYGRRPTYLTNFVPEGPLLVNHPGC